MQKGLILLVLFLVAGCASVPKTTPESMSRLQYGMPSLEVLEALNHEGALLFRGKRGGNHYFGIYYKVEATFRKYCLIFEDDRLAAVTPLEKFMESWTASAGDQLPYEHGFDALHQALVPNVIKLDQVNFSDVDIAARAESKRATLAGINEALAWSWIAIPLSPVLIPVIIADSNRLERFNDAWAKLPLDLPRESVIARLGNPWVARTNLNSDYEVMIFEASGSQWDKAAIGLRHGKIEWMNRNGYSIYEKL